METFGIKSNVPGLESTLKKLNKIYWNLAPAELIEHSIKKGQGVFNDTGAFAVDTGEFTGRSPKDKFTVKDETTANSVDWNTFNQPIGSDKFDLLLQDMIQYTEGKDIYVRDAYVCADPKYRMNV